MKPFYKFAGKVVGESTWERGLPWMRGSMDDALENEILKPAENLRLNYAEKEEYDRGLIFEKCLDSKGSQCFRYK